MEMILNIIGVIIFLSIFLGLKLLNAVLIQLRDNDQELYERLKKLELRGSDK